MGTKINENISNTLIPYCKHSFDSFKLFIDKDLFKSVTIPENFHLVDADTGVVVSDFKRNSLEIKYKNGKVYIANVKKELPHGTIEKVQIYFASKVSENYFNGILEEDVVAVIEHIKGLKYFDYDNIDRIIKGIYVKDLDIKYDMKFDNNVRVEIAEYNKELKQSFNGTNDNCVVFDNKKNGLGIQCNKRESASTAKPFIKFYDKSSEVKKNKEFYESLSEDVKKELSDNFIYRYEYTLKDKRYFDKYSISNKLVDLFKIEPKKWSEIGNDMLSINFEVQPKKPKDLSKLKPQEMTMCLYFKMCQDNGMTIGEQRALFIRVGDSKTTRFRQKALFDRIYWFVTGDDTSVRQITDSYNRIIKWHKFFGFIK